MDHQSPCMHQPDYTLGHVESTGKHPYTNGQAYKLIILGLPYTQHVSVAWPSPLLATQQKAIFLWVPSLYVLYPHCPRVSFTQAHISFLGPSLRKGPSFGLQPLYS